MHVTKKPTLNDIVQIIPSHEGWRAVLVGGEGTTREDPVTVLPVLCWALTEVEGGERRVVGLVSFGTHIDVAELGDQSRRSTFLAYIAPGEPLAAWRERAKHAMFPGDFK